MHIVITGGSSGIGAEVVRLLKARGDQVTALDIAPVAAADRWLPIDLSNPSRAVEVAEKIKDPIDALLCNAGLPPRKGNAAKLLSVNVFGLIDVAEALMPQIKDGGALITTASRAGTAWRENLAQVRRLLDLPGTEALEGFIPSEQIDDTRAYNLSKEAVIYWTKHQIEPLLARKIRCNSVSPAPVATGILDDFITAFGPKAEKALERVGRAGTAEEIAEVIVFLASPQARWINGQDIVTDGGMAGMLELDAA